MRSSLLHKYPINYRICFFLLIALMQYSYVCKAQDQSIADSLEIIYNSSREARKDLEILKGLANNSLDPIKRLKFSNELIEIAKNKDSKKYYFNGLLQRGHALTARGDYSKALESFFKAASIADSDKELGLIKVTLGDVYSLTKNHNRAIQYYNEGIEIIRKTGDKISLGSALLNTADEYLKNDQVEKAISYLKEAEEIFLEVGYDYGRAYVVGTLGLAYAKLGRNEEAEENIQFAIQYLEKYEDYSPICEFLSGMSDIYAEKGRDSTAIEFALLSRDLAKAYGFKNEIREANLRLSQIYEDRGDLPESYKYYKEYIVYKDSVMNVSTAQSMAGLRADYEVAQKQAEVDLLNIQRENQKLVVISIAVASFFICLIAFGLYRILLQGISPQPP